MKVRRSVPKTGLKRPPEKNLEELQEEQDEKEKLLATKSNQNYLLKIHFKLNKINLRDKLKLLNLPKEKFLEKRFLKAA